MVAFGELGAMDHGWVVFEIHPVGKRLSASGEFDLT